MTAYFCDTSAVVKLYHNELGTDYMETIFNDDLSGIVISELTTVEMFSALARKVRIREITSEARDLAVRNFNTDCTDKFVVNPLNYRITRRARNLIDLHGTRYSIRALDALQLATCLEEHTDGLMFVCADLNLIRICELEGINAINPETE